MFMIQSNVEACLKPCQISMKEFFLELVNVQKLLTVLKKPLQKHRCLRGSAASSTKFNKNSEDFQKNICHKNLFITALEEKKYEI